MQHTHLHANGPPRGHATLGTLILAAASAVAPVLMSGCHEAPAANAFAATPADKATETRLKQPQTMPALQPFDEHFVEVPQDE
ncbi:MAG: hypothetical protein ACJ8GJ_03205 [Vitreoscilla sp.]